MDKEEIIKQLIFLQDCVIQPNEQVSTYGPLQKICHNRCIDCVCPCPEKLKDDVGGVVH